jgi:hypothetical protein
VREIAHVSAAEAVLTASFFAQRSDDPYTQVKRWLEQRTDLQFVSLDWLRTYLEAVGFQDYHWRLPGGWFGYISTRIGAT